MRPEDIDISRGALIAFASSEGDGRDRWTELEVHHFDAPPVPRRHWLSISRGCSIVPGEKTKERRLLVGSLDRALKLFDEGVDLGVIVCEQAREWAEEHIAGAPARSQAVTSPPAYIRTDREALSWLYRAPADQLPPVLSMAADLGLGESSLRMALKNGTGVRVPLMTIAPLIDREAFARRHPTVEGKDDHA